MLFLTLFACFVKYAPVATPQWEASSKFSDLGIAKEDCAIKLRNQELQRLGLCKQVGSKTICQGTLKDFRISYGVHHGVLVCRVLR